MCISFCLSQVVDDSRKWWKARNYRGQVAHVPHTIVTPYQGGDQPDVFSNPLYAPPRGYAQVCITISWEYL